MNTWGKDNDKYCIGVEYPHKPINFPAPVTLTNDLSISRQRNSWSLQKKKSLHRISENPSTLGLVYIESKAPEIHSGKAFSIDGPTRPIRWYLHTFVPVTRSMIEGRWLAGWFHGLGIIYRLSHPSPPRRPNFKSSQSYFFGWLEITYKFIVPVSLEMFSSFAPSYKRI